MGNTYLVKLVVLGFFTLVSFKTSQEVATDFQNGITYLDNVLTNHGLPSVLAVTVTEESVAPAVEPVSPAAAPWQAGVTTANNAGLEAGQLKGDLPSTANNKSTTDPATH